MPKVQTRAGLVNYAEQGSGPPLVLLHATLHDHRDYNPVLERLAVGHRVIAVDWPGHGNSEEASELSARLLADTLVDIVEALDLRELRVIGNSVGGFAAARLAITHPERVAGLILVANGGFATNPISRAFCRIMGTPAVTRRIMPRFIGSYMQPQSENDRQIVQRAQQRARTPAGVGLCASLWRSFATPGHDLRARAVELRAPTLIVWGKRDRAIPASVGKATHKAIAGSQLEILDTGHVVFSSQPDAFLRIAEPFLRSIAAQSARSVA